MRRLLRYQEPPTIQPDPMSDACKCGCDLADHNDDGCTSCGECDGFTAAEPDDGADHAYDLWKDDVL